MSGNLTLDHFVAMKRAFQATLPPPMLALKCHPATESLIRRTIAAVPPDALGSFLRPPIYIDVTVPPGKVFVAETREVAEHWRWLEEIKHAAWRHDERVRLIGVRRRRLAALEAQ